MFIHNSNDIFNFIAEGQTFTPFGWWLSRQNRRMDYWAGALPGSRKCQCGIVGNCIDPTKWCNCDANLYEWQEDGGEIKDKEYLPVRGLRFGDTGTALDEKQAKYTLGPLVCEGDDLFNNVVTFRITDATINLPRFDMGHSGDIYLEFKTTQENSVLFHAKGGTDYIKLSIIAGNKLKFQYQAGSGPLGVDVETSYPLNDNNWHSVSVERNRKEARLVVDGATKSEVREPPGNALLFNYFHHHHKKYQLKKLFQLIIKRSCSCTLPYIGIGNWSNSRLSGWLCRLYSCSAA